MRLKRFTEHDIRAKVVTDAHPGPLIMVFRAGSSAKAIVYRYPCKHPISDPYHNAGQFGAVLSNAGWIPNGVLHDEFARLARELDQDDDKKVFGVVY